MATRTFFRGIERSFATIGVITVGTFTFSVYQINKTREKARKQFLNLPDAFILDLDFENFELVEKAAPIWTKISAPTGQLELRKVIQSLKQASSDSRVKGVFASFGANQSFAGLAQIQEIRESIEEFRLRTQGKVATVAFAESFGEGGQQGTMPYYLGSAFEKVYMQPSGFLSVNGFAATVPFLKRFLERFDIKAYFFAREKYKNLANQYTHEKFSPEHREATEGILQGFLGQVISGIATSRGLSEKDLRTIIDSAPLDSEQALQSKLLDGAKYRDEALSTLPTAEDKPGKDLPRVNVRRYALAQAAAKRKTEGNWLADTMEAWEESDQGSDKAKQLNSKKPVVAVITACGPIVAGRNSQGPFQKDQQIASGELCSILSKVREQEAVKAVVLRLDTPGGSAVGSDAIHREMVRLKEAGKPVIVSMANVSASGGYYISAPATKIVASPATLTGSIGVVFGKFNISPLLKNYGVDAENVKSGKNSDAMLPVTGFTPEQVDVLNHLIDVTYECFLSKVAAGRGKSLEEVRKLAGGRIWIGADALAHGLVDQLGGLQDAIALAKREAGLPFQEDLVEVKDFPKPRSPIALLIQRLRSGGAVANLAPSPQPSQTLAALAAFLGASGDFLGASDPSTPQALLAVKILQDLQRQSGPLLVSPELVMQQITG